MMQNKKLAIKGGIKTVSLKGPHYIWPPITKTVERAVLKQLRSSISIYNRSGIFEKFENSFASYHKKKIRAPYEFWHCCDSFDVCCRRI